MSAFSDMTYDELNAYITNGARLWTETEDVLDEMDRKSAVMTAICELAAELDAEGYRLIRLRRMEPPRLVFEDEYGPMHITDFQPLPRQPETK